MMITASLNQYPINYGNGNLPHNDTDSSDKYHRLFITGFKILMAHLYSLHASNAHTTPKSNDARMAAPPTAVHSQVAL